MGGILYFAYGSNMLSARLRARCPSARLLGPAWAEGHCVRFEKRGMDGSGKAALIAADPDKAAGVLYAMESADLAALDRFEGAGHGYDRVEDVTIRHGNRPARAMTYLACDPQPGLVPFDWYLALILAGARQHGFAASYLNRLGGHPWQADPDPDRPGRRAALQALAAHGHADPAALLQPLLNGVQSASAAISPPIASRS